MTSRAYALRLTRTSSRTLGTATRTSNCPVYILADKTSSTIPTRRVLSTSRHYSSTSTSSSHRYPTTSLLTSTSTSSTLRHQQQHLLTSTRIQPSAYFCTHPAFRQLQSTSSISANQEQHNTEEHSKELKALVGLPCPGCGSAFQISHPQEPGYLTRLLDGPLSSSSASLEKGKGKGKKGKKTAPAVAEGATTMSHDQYEAYLERLDPKILQEMGILPPPSDPVAEGGEERAGGAMDAGAGSGSGSSEATTAAAAGEAEPAVEVLDRKPSRTSSSQPVRIVCHRCHSLSHHASPLANSSILPSSMFPSPPAPVPKHLETLAQSKTSTVVLVVDLIDFPLSLPQPIIQELLKSKKLKKSVTTGTRAGAGGAVKKDYPTTPIILVGNKFDVMPSGTRKQTIIQNIQSYLTSHGLDDNIRAIHLVSAKNPEGDEIRMLLKSIGTAWTKSGKGNVVMVGGENVGKSQLVNAFLKEGGRWRMSGVQVERERFGAEKAERQKKLSLLLGTSATSAPEDDTDKDNEEDKEWAAMTGKDSVGADMDKYETLYKDRGQEKLAKYQTTVSNVPGTTLERIKVPLSVLSRFMGATYKEVQTKWLMDTPGIRPAAGQLTSWLTLEELKVALPKKVLKPVSFTLEEGKSFFLGGLVRIDCLSIGKPTLSPSTTSQDPTTPPSRRPRGSNPAPKLTIFTTLPLHKTSTPGADKFLEKINSGQLTILQPPFGTPERLAAFPGLKPVSSKDIVIVNRAPSPSSFSSSSSSSSDSSDPFARLGSDSSSLSSSSRSNQESSPLTRRERETASLQYAGQYGICDLVFSSIGWVMISGKFHGDDQAVRLKVWTPQGQGAMVREPALLPDLAAQQIEKTSGGVRGKGQQGRKVFQALSLSPSSSSEE